MSDYELHKAEYHRRLEAFVRSVVRDELRAASAMSAGTAETAQQAQGRSPASATAEGRDAQPIPPSQD